MSREGDWMCAACQHLNFKKRDACQRCSFPKYATPADVSMYGLNKTEVMAGDWYSSAMNCGGVMDRMQVLFLVGRVVIGFAAVQDRKIMSREGDWMCSACHTKFQETGCMPTMPLSKYATSADAAMYGLNKTDVLAGDWYCSAMNCGSHNYASRTSCYRCGASKSDCSIRAGMMAPAGYGYDASALPGWKSGD
ncbi:hypothetical protein HAX54_015093 [Datura stramonium]|uniref:RanBP2-type domain-containing protein n=1 Tax=Datura stramonium TaxID=4076 RepID=A0ABS8TS43_DATST|nr:hypothetical protein [Datura stramonium]